MGKFLTRVDALCIPQVTVLCGRCRFTALTAKKICLDILHQSSGSVNFGRFGLGRRPSYPTGYRPVWLSLGHCPHSQGNQVGFSPPVSWIGNFWSACLGSTPIISHGLPSRVTVEGSLPSTVKEICLDILHQSPGSVIFWIHCVGTTPFSPHGLPSRVTGGAFGSPVKKICVDILHQSPGSALLCSTNTQNLHNSSKPFKISDPSCTHVTLTNAPMHTLCNHECIH